MKPIVESPWKQRVLFFFAGAFLASICWIAPVILPINNTFREAGWFVGWIPLVACALIIVLRFVKGQKVRVGLYILGTVTPIIALVGFLLFEPTVNDLIHRQKFDAELWRNQKAFEEDTMWPPRLRMVDNLMRSRKLDGLTKDQVIDLLGPPHDKKFPFGAKYCDIHYYLGPERGLFRIDSEWLFIKFGENGTVTQYWLYKD